MQTVIILEGISGCGKSTLLHPINELTNYRDPVVPRFTPTMWVYNKLYNRPEISYEYVNHGLQKWCDLHVVWLRVNPDIAKLRQIEKRDPITEDLHRADELFEEYFSTITIIRNVHRVATDALSIEESVALIDKKVYGGR